MEQIRILVVDDLWKENKGVFETFLTEDKFDVVYAENPRDFKTILIESFDAVLLDINLDAWDNMPLAEACRIIGSRSPVILVSMMMKEKITEVRIQEALSSSSNVNIIQTFDLRLLKIGSDDDKAQTAKIFSTLIKIAISCSVKTAPFFVDSNSVINILHISDLQYGDPDTDDWSKYIENGIADFLFTKYPEIHFIVVTGDIAYSGSYDEYNQAGIGLKRLIEGLWNGKSKKGRIIVVPGNHDVDFRFSSVPFLKPTFSDKEVGIKYISSSHVKGHAENINYGMLPFRKFAFDLTGDNRWITSDDLSWLDNQFLHLGIRFIVLNSANQISCKSPKLPSIAEDTTDRLATELFNKGKTDVFTIACSHHGPLDPEDSNKIEHLTDWPRLSNWLSQSGLNLWIHGHGHKRLVMPHPFGENTIEIVKKYAEELKPDTKYFMKDDEFVRVMAATTHLNNKLRPQNVRKGFNVISLKRENGITADVEVLSYELADKSPKKITGKPPTFNFN